MCDAHISLFDGESIVGNQAAGTFEVTSWDEKTYEDLGGEAKLTHARIRQEFTGDLVATGTWEVLMCYCADGTASYSGLVRVVGRLSGRSGALVLRTNGGFDGDRASWAWSVIPGSATGELEGLTGDGEVVAPHGSTGSYVLDHNLAPEPEDRSEVEATSTGSEPACQVRMPEAESELA